MNYQKQWVERNDNLPGTVYLLEAEGFHGRLEGKFIKRCKIGLTRDLQNRLYQLESGQPPCNYKVLRTIFVEDMAQVEGDLHAQFKHCSVKLHRSKEFFDFNPLQLWQVQQAFSRYEKQPFNLTANLPSRLVVASLIGLLGSGLLIHSAMSQPEPPKPNPTATATSPTQPKVLHKNYRTQGRKNFAY